MIVDLTECIIADAFTFLSRLCNELLAPTQNVRTKFYTFIDNFQKFNMLDIVSCYFVCNSKGVSKEISQSSWTYQIQQACKGALFNEE